MLKTIVVTQSLSFLLCLSCGAQTVIPDLEVTDRLRISSSVLLNGGAEIQTSGAGSGVSYPEFKLILNDNTRFVLGNSNSMDSSSGISYMFGNSNALNITWESFVIGSYNQLSNAEYSYIIGKSNNLNPQGKRSFVFGNANTLKARDSMMLGSENVINSAASGSNAGTYVFGANLHVTPASALAGVMLMGFNNSENLNFENPDSGSIPFFILGNGYAATPSNALVIQRNGRATVTHKAYIVPTTQNPVPTQPETWVVEGATTLKGQVDINGIVHVKPGGDLDMGAFTSAPGAP